MTEKRKRIVIVGGNFAGLTAAIKLSRRHAVTVVDPSRHFEWAPGIHEILSSVKTPQGLRLDRAAIVKQAGHRFLRDRVTVLQPTQGRLATVGGHELEFDACIVAVGAQWNTHHVPGVARHAMPFRSVADGVAIEHRLDTLVQQGQPLLDRQAVGDAAERHCVAGHARDVMGVPQRTHRHDADIERQFVAAGRGQPAPCRLQHGHAVPQEAVPGLLDDGGAVQAQPLRRLHARQDLVDAGRPLEVPGRVDDRHGMAPRQLDRGRQAGEVAADDGDAFALVGHGVALSGIGDGAKYGLARSGGSCISGHGSRLPVRRRSLPSPPWTDVPRPPARQFNADAASPCMASS